MSIQRVDLNLFRVFEAVLQYGSVSAVAREFGVTPSAISHALSRLRQAVGDELFVYGDEGMAPTPRALELAPAIRDGLGRIDEALKSPAFEPSQTARTFRLSATDYSTTIILPRLLQHLVRVAPQLELRVFPYNRTDVIRHLDEGRLDLVLGWFSDVPEHVRRTPILQDREAVVVRPGHPLTLRDNLTRDCLFGFSFVVVEFSGSGEPAMDGFLDERGVWRRVWIDRLVIERNGGGNDGGVSHVAVSLPHYSAVPHLLAVTDMMATVPERLARLMEARGEVVVLDLPYAPLVAPVDAIWHRKGEQDAGLQWLLRELAAVMPAEQMQLSDV
ncbi:LysR family transcriptional regulator [Xanthobacter sp. TB0139]|uniref:LysR family transcriptional regulator n=1 Tax=Xanthobacter sp. TB0139 TaxID=3459178 RepID=UPI00403A006F